MLQDLLNKGGTEGVPKLTMDNLIDTLFECLKKVRLCMTHNVKDKPTNLESNGCVSSTC